MRERLLEHEKELDKRIAESPPRPPAIRTFTDADREKFKKLDDIFHKIIYDSHTDPFLIQELLEQAGFLADFGSARLWDLQRKFAHYKTLAQSAAKHKLWAKMYDVIYGLHIEVSNARARMERGGKGVQ